jgi:hypothetical protein
MALFKLSVFILFYFCARIIISACEPTVNTYEIADHRPLMAELNSP